MPRKRRMAILAEGNLISLKSKTANGAIVYLRDEMIGVIHSTKAAKRDQEVLGCSGEVQISCGGKKLADTLLNQFSNSD